MTNRWLDTILYQLLPGKCTLCSAKSQRYLDLCAACEADLPRIPIPCWQCGLPLSLGEEVCILCRQQPPNFAHCFSAFRYAPPIDLLINQFKNQQKIIMGRVLATLLAQYYIQEHLVFPDIWLPMPLHKQKLKTRGFNQALEIAEVLADMTKIPLRSRSCRRIKHTDAQKSLSASDRAKNIKGAFMLDENIQGLSIGIVDDVVTTGATVSELSAMLLTYGAREIQVVCLARTPALQPQHAHTPPANHATDLIKTI